MASCRAEVNPTQAEALFRYITRDNYELRQEIFEFLKVGWCIGSERAGVGLVWSTEDPTPAAIA